MGNRPAELHWAQPMLEEAIRLAKKASKLTKVRPIF